MKGEFQVKEVIQHGTAGPALSGTVLSGQLRPGMEARIGSIVIIIAEISGARSKKTPLKSARAPMKVLVRPMQTVYEVLQAVEGRILEFDDMRSSPLKKVFALKPSLA